MNTVTDNKQAALARKENLVVQEMPDEMLVYDLKQHKAHCLNQTAAFVWGHCDGRTTAAEIAKLMEEKWSKPASEGMVWLALEKLSRANLLQEPIALPPAQAGISRRMAVRQLGLGAMLAVPVVISVVAPAAAQASSCAPNRPGCTPNGNQFDCRVSSDCCSCCCQKPNGPPAANHCTGANNNCIPG
jgi:hypothetical protein